MRKTTILSALIITLFTSCRGQSNSVATTISQDKIPTAASRVPKDSTTLYFPLDSFSDTSKKIPHDPFFINWFSEQLFALGEPVVYLDSSQAEIYRFTWLRTFHNPIAIRIEKRGDSYVIYWKLSNGAGGYKPGKLTIDKQRVVDKEIWDRFSRKVNQLDFWNLSVKEDNIGFDGSEWILEGKSVNKYHVVKRWTPNKSSKFYECCNFLLGLTNLKISDKDKY